MFEDIKTTAAGIALFVVFFLVAFGIYYVVKNFAKLIYSFPVVAKFAWKLLGNGLFVVIVILLLLGIFVAAFKEHVLIGCICLALASLLSIVHVHKTSVKNRWIKTTLCDYFTYGVLVILGGVPFAIYQKNFNTAFWSFVLALSLATAFRVLSKLQSMEEAKVVFLKIIESYGFRLPGDDSRLKISVEKLISSFASFKSIQMNLTDLHQFQNTNGQFVAGKYHLDEGGIIAFFLLGKLQLEGLSDPLQIEKQHGFKHELKIKGQEVFDNLPEDILSFFKKYSYDIYFNNGLLLAEFDVTLIPHHDFEADFDCALKTMTQWK